METVVSGLAENLSQRGHQVDVLSLCERADTIHQEEEHHRGVTYRRLKRLGWSRYPFARGLSAALAGADLVHVHGVDGLLDQTLLGRRRHGAAVGLSTHGAYFHEERFALAKRAVLHTWTRPMLRRLDGLWYTSRSDQETLGGRDAKGKVIPNGLDLERWSTIERKPERGRWLLLGRPAPHKGHDDFFEVLSRINPDKRPETIDLVGAGSESQWRHVRELAEGLGIEGVVVHGTVSDIELLALVARCERAIFPSRYEGFGLGVVELMAASVPVVVSDIAPHRERVVEESCGLVVAFSDVDAAADKLSRLSDHRDDLAAGRARALAFDWSRIADVYEQAYHTAVASR